MKQKIKLQFIVMAIVVVVMAMGVGYIVAKQVIREAVSEPTQNDKREASKSDAVWKTIASETAYGAGTEFAVKYPSDWHEIQLRERGALSFHEWPADNDSCLITLGTGGGGVGEGDNDVSIETNSKMYGNLPATKQTFKQDGKILKEVTSFSRDSVVPFPTTEFIFELLTQTQADYNKCKQDYEDILATFKFL